MNAFFSAFERALVGGSDDPRDCPLLRFPPGRLFTQRAFFEGILVMASVGRGKTTLARTLCRALLRDYFGGLVLTVKSSQVAEFRDLMRFEDREQDCVLLGPGHANCFNPLEHETDANEAAALVMELSEVLASQASEGRKDEVFWQQQLAIILRHLFTLCWVQHERLDLRAAAELLDSRANTAAQLHDPSWRRSSLLWSAITKARMQSPLPESVRLACEYFEVVFLTHGDRLQGS